jgi:nitroreductase
MADRPSGEEYHEALSLAVRAPSLHNTQPWRWTVTDEGLVLHADRERQLPTIDMDGHGLLVSCGASLELARLGLRAAGWRTEVDRCPDPADHDLLAVLRPTVRARVTPEVVERVRAAQRRRSERRPFAENGVPEPILDELRAAAAEPGVYLDFVVHEDERLELAVAATWADRYERSDNAYREELAAWTHRGEEQREGIPSTAIPHRVKEGVRHTEVPVRDFEQGRPGELPVSDDVDEQPALGVLFTVADDTESRLRAGEALVRALVRAEELGLATSLISQPVDFPGVRERVRMLMSWVDHPHMVMRVGWPPPGAVPPPPTPRRPVDEAGDGGG